FSKCYREYFGVPPRDERSGVQNRQGRKVDSPPPGKAWATEPSANEPVSTALLALAHAKGEPTFASVPLLK
ncbi:MAG: GlxA family transcriptional regulator, partial [Halomonas sp.]|nr:GlxA family transcriptional regulator [Halomonas sp.]